MTTIDAHIATLDARDDAAAHAADAGVDAAGPVADANVDAQPAATSVVLLSEDSNGVQGNAPAGDDVNIAISADGNLVAFTSAATNLVANDTNNASDVFLRNVATGVTTCVSVTPSGVPGNDFSTQPSMSGDGRFVVFVSNATDLVDGINDTNGQEDIFLRDTMLNTTTLISVNDDGVISNSYSYQPWISADGRYVVYGSNANNLVAGDTNASEDIFMRDTVMNTTTLVSVATNGDPANSLSYNAVTTPDGRFVVFYSYADNFAVNDINGHADVFVRDTMLNTTTIVSVNSAGEEGNDESQTARISADGRFIAFNSFATNLVPNDNNAASDMFMRDTLLGTTSLITVTTGGVQADQGSDSLDMSSDGRFVLLATFADNLTPNATPGVWNVTVHDMRTGVNTLVSSNVAGVEGNGQAGVFPAISADGQFVAFSSDGDNIVPGDTNSGTDEFRTSLFPHEGILALADGDTTSSTGASVNISIALGTQPTADVTVALSVSIPADASLTPPSLTFTSDNWNVPQIVTVTGLNNSNATGNDSFTVDFANATSADLIYNDYATPSIVLAHVQKS